MAWARGSARPSHVARSAGQRPRAAGAASRRRAFAAWAPIIPFAKANTGVDEAALGLLLLCLGIGSVVSMPITGWLCARHGTRPMILSSAMIMACALPFLAVLQTISGLFAAHDPA